MGDAGGAVDLVHRADAHPHHLHRRRRAAVGLDDEVMPLASVNCSEPLGQAGLRGRRAGARRRERANGGDGRGDRDEDRPRRRARRARVFHRMARIVKSRCSVSSRKNRRPKPARTATAPAPSAAPSRRQPRHRRPRLRPAAPAAFAAGGAPAALPGRPSRHRPTRCPRRSAAPLVSAGAAPIPAPPPEPRAAGLDRQAQDRACARPAPASPRCSSTRRSTRRCTRSWKTALLMADTGVKATEYLLADLQRRVKTHAPPTRPRCKRLLADAIAELLKPLEKAAGHRRVTRPPSSWWPASTAPARPPRSAS